MKSRIQVSIALAVLSFPLLGLGLLDPLEGLPALIMGLTALIIARILSDLKVPKLAWIALLITILLLAVALLLISLELETAQNHAVTQMPTSTKVGNALAGPASWLLWASRISLIAMLVGIAIYVRNLFGALKAMPRTKGN